ncbi:MAG: sugar phosphate isomerase/epimerase [Planctomycetes bacterium]|nr:sugar phosphate isomerase/epimerase [Planctomycetota bacterium]
MIRSAVTVSLVAEARGGPFVFWDDLPAACLSAAQLGFDAIEIFAPSAEAVGPELLKPLLEKHNLSLAAVGTGAGMVIHGLTLTSADAAQRGRAIDFVKSMIDFGAPYRAPAIIGSMQGRWGGDLNRDAALALLRDALNELGTHAAEKGVPLIYEPLNRYETNLITTIADGVELMKSLSTDNVKLLADLFHMNIEESNVAAAVLAGRGHIGHVHFVDSNRQAAGRGHTDFAPIAAALREIGYDGYASAEALPIPNSEEAARQTIASYREHFGE